MSGSRALPRTTHSLTTKIALSIALAAVLGVLVSTLGAAWLVYMEGQGHALRTAKSDAVYIASELSERLSRATAVARRRCRRSG